MAISKKDKESITEFWHRYCKAKPLGPDGKPFVGDDELRKNPQDKEEIQDLVERVNVDDIDEQHISDFYDGLKDLLDE